MELTREQAQVVADALRAADAGHVASQAIESLEANCPGFDWWALIDEEMADPRPRLPREPSDPAKVDASLREYVARVRRQLEKTHVFADLG